MQSRDAMKGNDFAAVRHKYDISLYNVPVKWLYRRLAVSLDFVLM